MTKVPLVAKSGFTYMTRRLVAGDEFEARNPLEARILTRVRKVAKASDEDSKPQVDLAAMTKAELAQLAGITDPAEIKKLKKVELIAKIEG
jgi:hypothetical protein